MLPSLPKNMDIVPAFDRIVDLFEVNDASRIR
jgi:hypothetical protein